MDIDLNDVVGITGNAQYQDRIAALEEDNIDTSSIKRTVEETIKNLEKARSLVIFGEPQSGKTEMMIALNARLLDEGKHIIVNLLTDSVDLLEQNLIRFQGSGLNPPPKPFNKLPDNPKWLRRQKWVVFCKKNARDLEKLIEILRGESKIIVIDDEADYASPNGKINSREKYKTKINSLIEELIGKDGAYIGVTATPARLDLNNTFENDSEHWIDFAPHPHYVGQDFFFPLNREVDYRLHKFEADEGNEKNQIEEAILHFLCGVAELHVFGIKKECFSMLVHTSGKKDEHAEDINTVELTLATLSDSKGSGFDRLRKHLWRVAEEYGRGDPDSIGLFALKHIRQNDVVEINSANPEPSKVSKIATPKLMFSFGVGGNIISRGVTFDNLLSMYFTRTVKGKYTQDTYIQRARMFGTRKDYGQFFQLWVPETLMNYWSNCFTFHKLALDAQRSAGGAPVWLSNHKIAPTASGSIDKSSVDFEGGEMSFALFKYSEKKVVLLFERGNRDDLEILSELKEYFDESQFPSYVHEYLKLDLHQGSKQVISFHKPSDFGTLASKYEDDEKRNIRRKKGIFATNEYKRSERPDARHHMKVFHNSEGQARLFYKINDRAAVKFIQRRR